jgi:hypothetical protein
MSLLLLGLITCYLITNNWKIKGSQLVWHRFRRIRLAINSWLIKECPCVTVRVSPVIPGMSIESALKYGLLSLKFFYIYFTLLLVTICTVSPWKPGHRSWNCVCARKLVLQWVVATLPSVGMRRYVSFAGILYYTGVLISP